MVGLKLKEVKLHTVLSNVVIVDDGKEGGQDDGAPLIRAQKRSE